MVSWSLQNGLSYEELGKLGQEMVDTVIPHYKSELKESVLDQIEKKWNQASDLSLGVLPSFNESVASLEDNLGELGKRIQGMRDYRDRLREVGYDYARLSELIDTSSRSQITGDTPWSKISDNIYARFVTQGSFGQIALPRKSLRKRCKFFDFSKIDKGPRCYIWRLANQSITSSFLKYPRYLLTRFSNVSPPISTSSYMATKEAR